MTALNTSKLKIEMVHDIVCSWCPIGYNNMQKAIENLNIAVDFRFLPFELNPEIPEEGEAIASYFSRQMGWNEGKLISYQQSLVTTAAKAGVSIDFSKRKYYYNTRNAHLLMHWAERFNKQTQLNERLIKAYFNDGLDISNLTVLLNIAEELGFDRQQTKAVLTSTHLRLELQQELAQKVARYKSFNIKSIPAFIFNGKTLVSGSNSVQYFEDTLSALSNELLMSQKSTV